MRTPDPSDSGERKVFHSPQTLLHHHQQQQQHCHTHDTLHTPPHDVARTTAMLQARNAPLLAPSPSRQQPMPLCRAESTTTTKSNSLTSAHCSLEITQQPPSKWYKDQFGRKATFELALQRVGRGCSACAEQRHFGVQLLYENGKTVENQSILRIASGLCLGKDDTSVVAVRIMEVSKNHQNQRFRLRIALPQCPLSGVTPSPAVTDAVLVLSKKNKRPPRSDGDDAQTTPSRPKRSRAYDSPMRNHAARVEASTPPPLSSTSASIAPDEFSATMPDAASWASQAARFTAPSASVCLWANAAYNFLHRLQWHRPPSGAATASALDNDDAMDAFLSSASATPYACPVCHARYGATPQHRSDCDLSLLLEQSGAFDSSPAQSSPMQQPPSPLPTAPHASFGTLQPQQSQPQQPLLFESALCAPRCDTAFPAPPPRVTPQRAHELLQFAETSPTTDAKPSPAPTLAPSSSLDALAQNLNLDSWEGYSTLSRIMFSTTLDMESAGAGAQVPPALLQDRLLRSSALAAAPHLPPVAPPPQPPSSFSTLVTSMKHLPADAAALLQEQDAELTGDASLLCSLSRVSLSDFLTSDAVATVPKADSRFLATLSSLLTDDHPTKSAATTATEDAVAVVVAADFRHCGLPALDASSALLGFYCCSGSVAQGTSDLRFLPNFYPLPPEMLHELEQSVRAWRADGSLVVARHTMSTGETEPLGELKQRVLACMASQT